MIARLALVLALASLLLPVSVAAGTVPSATHYLPRAGDSFAYSEEVVLNGGFGDYAGYTEHTFVNGSISVTAVAANESATTDYASTSNYYNNSVPGSEISSEHGTFGFSAATYLYVNGTDNQTGYTNPSVWFFIDNTVSLGGAVTLLNTPMTVLGTSASYPMASSATGYVVTIEAEGNGSFQRDDVYGVLSATYSWIAYFDPSTGYVVGYAYTEHDSNASGDGFTLTDTLSDTHTSFPLTAANAPSPPASSSGSGFPTAEIVLVVIVVVVVVAIVVAVILWARSPRRRGSGMAATGVPRHGGPGAPAFSPSYPSPPPVNLVPSGQPAVQQIVIRETVKVPCQFCGTLIDSTATVCPKCGAPRT